MSNEGGPIDEEPFGHMGALIQASDYFQNPSEYFGRFTRILRASKHCQRSFFCSPRTIMEDTQIHMFIPNEGEASGHESNLIWIL
jgi:hypothetical protein